MKIRFLVLVLTIKLFFAKLITIDSIIKYAVKKKRVNMYYQSELGMVRA